MKKKFNTSMLIPIPFAILFIGITFLNNTISNTTMAILIIFLFICLIVSVGLTSKDLRTVYRKFNSKKIKNLEENVYGHYSSLSKEFTYAYDPQTEYPVHLGRRLDKLKVEHFVVMIVKHNRFLPLYRHRFETMNPSDGDYFKLVHIYALYYLLENRIDDFKTHYKQYKDTIYLRTESRILDEKLYRIHFGHDYYDIPEYLLETMYEYYELGKSIDHEIMRYRPKCPLDEMIYMTLLYHYLEETENNTLLTDIEQEYLMYKEIRKNL